MRSEKQNPRRVCWQGHGGEVEVDPEAWTYSVQSVARLPRHAASAGAPETPQSAARQRHQHLRLGGPAWERAVQSVTVAQGRISLEVAAHAGA